jgi:hypothetical protein
MNTLDLPEPEVAAAAACDEALVQLALADGRFRLADGRLARQAYSCLVAPQAGDQVALARAATGLYIVHVLARPQPERARLGVPGAHALCLAQPRLELCATEGLALRSLGDVELCSAASVTISGQHVLASAAQTMVQNATHLVSHAQHCVLQVAALLRVHGQQALLTAEQDLKLDAERISLG